MKVVILAAGKGTRMLPLTEKVPKVLVEINSKPFLYYLLKSLQMAGYNEFGIVVGYMKEKVALFLQQYHFKATLLEQKGQKGTGDALVQAHNFVGKEDFVMVQGDNLWSVDDLKIFQKKDAYHYICGVQVENPQKYGVLITQNHFLQEIKEKPKEFVGNVINTGLFKFKADIFVALRHIKLSPRGELELTDAVSLLAKEGKVKVQKAQWWLDLGCLEDIPAVSKFLQENWKE